MEPEWPIFGFLNSSDMICYFSQSRPRNLSDLCKLKLASVNVQSAASFRCIIPIFDPLATASDRIIVVKRRRIRSTKHMATAALATRIHCRLVAYCASGHRCIMEGLMPHDLELGFRVRLFGVVFPGEEPITVTLSISSLTALIAFCA